MYLIKWNILFLLGGLIFISCNKNEEPKEISLKVANSQLVYQGEVSDKAGFNVQFINDTAKCVLRTVYIMPDDTLGYVKASVINNNLTINVITKPDDNPNWADISKLTKVHDVKFNLIGLRKGVYNLQLTVNNTTSSKSNFLIN